MNKIQFPCAKWSHFNKNLEFYELLQIYRLDNEPSEVKDIETPLKYQVGCNI